MILMKNTTMARELSEVIESMPEVAKTRASSSNQSKVNAPHAPRLGGISSVALFFSVLVPDRHFSISPPVQDSLVLSVSSTVIAYVVDYEDCEREVDLVEAVWNEYE